MDPQSSPDPTFRADVERAIAEDRPAVLVSLTDEIGRVAVAISDGIDTEYAADMLTQAATICREGVA